MPSPLLLPSPPTDGELSTAILLAFAMRQEAATAARVEKMLEDERRRCLIQEVLALGIQQAAKSQVSSLSGSSVSDGERARDQELEDEIESRLSASGSKRFPSERRSLALSGNCKTPADAARVVNVLGSTLRSKADPFIDAAFLPDPGSLATKRSTRGASVFFPDVLHKMLEETEKDGLSHIVSFLPHGRAFRVHNKEKFVEMILPKYFRGQKKWSSFSRQTNIYGFARVASGPDAGSYYHELFLKSRRDLTDYMRRVGKPHGADRRTFKLAEGNDPDFYAMKNIE